MLTMRASRPSDDLLQVGALQAGAIQLECLRRGELQAAADLLPRPVSAGQQRDGAHRRGAAFAALHAVVQADRGGPRGGVLARQLHDLFGGDAGEFRRALRRPRAARARAAPSKPLGVALHVIGVVQVLADDDVHHGRAPAPCRCPG